MTNKNERIRETFERVHDDLFDDATYTAEFFSYSAGTYDSGTQTGRTRESQGSTNCEIVPPASDSTIRRSGTDLSFSTSIRIPLDRTLISNLDWPGEDVKKPSEVEITDNIDNSTETYQVSSYSEERGSGFVMIRLEEL